VLSAIIATILLFYFADMAGLKGNARKWFGWLAIIFSDVAFAATTVLYIKRLIVSEAAQQPLVDAVMVFIEIGLGTLLVVLGLFMFWRLTDLFKKDGLWKAEMAEPGREGSQ